MENYKVRIPGGKFAITAVNRKEAIDMAIIIFRENFEMIISSGDIYKVPDVCKPENDGLTFHGSDTVYFNKKRKIKKRR